MSDSESKDSKDSESNFSRFESCSSHVTLGRNQHKDEDDDDDSELKVLRFNNSKSKTLQRTPIKRRDVRNADIDIYRI